MKASNDESMLWSHTSKLWWKCRKLQHNLERKTLSCTRTHSLCVCCTCRVHGGSTPTTLAKLVINNINTGNQDSMPWKQFIYQLIRM